VQSTSILSGESFSTEGWNPYSKQLSAAYDSGQDPLQVVVQMMDSGGVDHEKQRLGLRPEGFFQIFLAVSDLLLRSGMDKALRMKLLDVRRKLADAVRDMGDDLKEGVDVCLAAHSQQLRDTNGVEQLCGEMEHSLTLAMAENLQRIGEQANSDAHLAKAEADCDYREIILCCTAACEGAVRGVDGYFREFESVVQSIKAMASLAPWMELAKARQKLQIATYWNYRLALSLIPEGEAREQAKENLTSLLRPELTAGF
jgi:hypothetical protein